MAAVQDDNYLQHSDDQFSRMEIDPRIYNEIRNFIQQGMPPASVMLHAVSLGVPIDDVVEMCTRADGSRAQLFYDTAISLLPSLPGWACRASRSSAGRHAPNFNAESLGPAPSAKEVASRFFDSDARLSPFPDWESGASHMNASTQELLSMLDEQEYWYQPGSQTSSANQSFDPRRPVFISLYQDRDQAVIDSDPGLIRAAAAAGLPTMPVVFIYNEAYQRPISRFGNDVSLREVADEFFSSGHEVTPVPEWRSGDYHMKAETDEIRDMFDIPSRDQIDPARWADIEADLRVNGFKKPLMVTMLRDGERMWVDQPERAAVAAELGMAEMPIVYYYHGFDRMACGAEATSCQDMICDASIAGGASSSVCQRASGGYGHGKKRRQKSFGMIGPKIGSKGGAPGVRCEDAKARENDPACSGTIVPTEAPRTPKQPSTSSSF